MQIAHVSLSAPLRAWREQERAWWASLDATSRTVVQLSLVVGGTLVAYHYSLLTLLEQLDVQSPLAYVGLVPVFALALAVAYMTPKAGEPNIYDRQIDYIVGVPLLAVAAAITMLLPHHMSATFWQWRVDLLAVPPFVAGLVAIVFGTRVLWRQRLAVLYLLLALPALYTVVLASTLVRYTNFTVDVLRDLLHYLPVARADAVPGDPLFTVTHHGSSFPLAVVTACSGVDGLVGFLLIGLLFAAMMHGPLLKKWLWLLSGLPLLWSINLGRIMFIFWAGQQWGEKVALDVFHPVIGLVTFSAGVTLWALAHRWAGLRLSPFALGPRRPAGEPAVRARVLPVPAIAAAAVFVVVASVGIGFGDTSLKAYNLVETAVGEPRLTSFLVSPARVPGWRWSYEEQFQNGKPEFGLDSLWYRYLYQPVSQDGASPGHGPGHRRRHQCLRAIGFQRLYPGGLLQLPRLDRARHCRREPGWRDHRSVALLRLGPVRGLVGPVLDLAGQGHGRGPERHPLRACRTVRPGRPAGVSAGSQDGLGKHRRPQPLPTFDGEPRFPDRVRK